ncbi:MAG: hypothetical protein KIS79_09665 [Burkholderiales bacterium]|nr:hypothetical protein [Burkholderiales bacterium]
MPGQESHTARLPVRVDWKIGALAAIVVLLLALVALGVQREMRMPATARTTALPMTERGVERPALSAAEEAYAASLWTVHSQAKQDAVRMTSAGLAYQMKDIDTTELRARADTLVTGFRQAQQRMGDLTPPPALQPIHQRYLNALGRYEQAAQLMLRFTSDSNNAHLLKAQELSQLSSEDLLRVSDVLWPGEHKPN